MSHAYSNILVHAVWSTKNRQPYITKDIKVRLHGYLRNAVDNVGAKLLFINGVEDHVHLLFAMPFRLMPSYKKLSPRWGTRFWLYMYP